jgi:hypothetical protein
MTGDGFRCTVRHVAVMLWWSVMETPLSIECDSR